MKTNIVDTTRAAVKEFLTKTYGENLTIRIQKWSKNEIFTIFGNVEVYVEDKCANTYNQRVTGSVIKIKPDFYTTDIRSRTLQTFDGLKLSTAIEEINNRVISQKKEKEASQKAANQREADAKNNKEIQVKELNFYPTYFKDAERTTPTGCEYPSKVTRTNSGYSIEIKKSGLSVAKMIAILAVINSPELTKEEAFKQFIES